MGGPCPKNKSLNKTLKYENVSMSEQFLFLFVFLACVINTLVVVPSHAVSCWL